jgi:hypothetical protein
MRSATINSIWVLVQDTWPNEDPSSFRHYSDILYSWKVSAAASFNVVQVQIHG